MLSEKYSYIAFDFEATGLSIEKDEPIQIGIVQFDHNFSITRTYSSRICPKKTIKELKSIVQHITGFSLESLKDAPSFKTILPEIEDFFGPNTVVVGHNIDFDVALLNKYLPFQPAYMVDTYPFSKTFFHFLPSYALEIINEHLLEEGKGRKSEEGNYHDALYDSYLSYNLFKVILERITHLRHNYIILDYLIQKSEGMLANIIKRTHKPFNFTHKKLFFPALQQKISQSSQKIIRTSSHSFSEYQNLIKINTYELSLKSIIYNTKRENEKHILAFSHPSKANIAQDIFKQLKIQTHSLHNAVEFNQDRINTFLHQESFDDEEILFSYKYYSQFEKKQKILDINTQEDYKIFGALSEQGTNKKDAQITICTHDQLYNMKKNANKDQTLLFFDVDWRYQNYNKHAKKTFDPQYLINQLDQIAYKHNLLSLDGTKHIKKLMEQTVFLTAIVNIELNKFFKGKNIAKLDIVDILNNARFPRTQQLFSKRKETYLTCQKFFLEEDNDIHQKFTRYEELLSGETTISKRMYNGDKRYYIFQSTHIFTDRNEFIDELPKTKKTIFLTNNKQNNKEAYLLKKDSFEKLFNSFCPLKHITSKEGIKKMLDNKNGKGIFIVSNSKEKSKELYDYLIQNKCNQHYEIAGENITGGVGKNIYRAGISSKPVILIGSLNFYLSAMAGKINIGAIYLYHLYGKTSTIIVGDLLRWHR